MRPETPLRVLVVDDHPGFGETLAEVLTASGCEADVAITPFAGITCSDASRYDLALVDVQMPQMNGLELLTFLNRRGHRCLLLMTAYPDLVDLGEAQANGAEGVLQKPLDLERLLAIVKFIGQQASEERVKLPATLLPFRVRRLLPYPG